MYLIVDCGPLSNPENGVVTFSSTQAGSTARYSCNSGFILRGNQVRVCQANGVWSGQDPVCIRNGELDVFCYVLSIISPCSS